MNILEAFEKSDKIKGMHMDPPLILDKTSGWHFTMEFSDLEATDWEPVIETLTFELIKRECVPGETLLIGDDLRERLYLGFARNGELVTDSSNNNSINASCPMWKEAEIKNWQISSEKWEG